MAKRKKDFCIECGNSSANCVCEIPGKPESKKINRRCSHEFRGERCKREGTISKNTSGGGPWYCCRAHMEGDASTPPPPKPARDWRDATVDADIEQHGYADYVPKSNPGKREYLRYILDCMASRIRPKKREGKAA